MTPRLWLCADLSHPNAHTLVARVTRAVTVGRVAVWLRSPHGAPGRVVASHAHALRVVTQRHGCSLFVGDRLDVALAVGADGVHLPERSFEPLALLRSGLLRSRAAHDLATVIAHRGHVDLLVGSPVGAVPGKGEALGFEGLRSLCAAAGSTPVIALGGIRTRDDVTRCLEAGAAGVAARGALMDGDDPRATCAALFEALQG